MGPQPRERSVHPPAHHRSAGQPAHRARGNELQGDPLVRATLAGASNSQPYSSPYGARRRPTCGNAPLLLRRRLRDPVGRQERLLDRPWSFVFQTLRRFVVMSVKMGRPDAPPVTAPPRFCGRTACGSPTRASPARHSSSIPTPCSSTRRASTSPDSATTPRGPRVRPRRLPYGRVAAGDHFDYPADYRPEPVTEGAFGLIRSKPTRVRIRFDPRSPAMSSAASGTPRSGCIQLTVRSTSPAMFAGRRS